MLVFLCEKDISGYKQQNWQLVTFVPNDIYMVLSVLAGSHYPADQMLLLSTQGCLEVLCVFLTPNPQLSLVGFSF